MSWFSNLTANLADWFSSLFFPQGTHEAQKTIRNELPMCSKFHEPLRIQKVTGASTFSCCPNALVRRNWAADPSLRKCAAIKQKLGFSNENGILRKIKTHPNPLRKRIVEMRHRFSVEFYCSIFLLLSIHAWLSYLTNGNYNPNR